MIEVNGKNSMQNTILEQVKENWPLVADVVSLPHTEEEYEHAIALLDELIDDIGEEEDHPLASLMETLGSLIEAYENDHLPEPLGDPISTLRTLMTEHRLTNDDLPEIGDATTISAILNYQRELTQTEIWSLGERFHVSPMVFL